MRGKKLTKTLTALAFAGAFLTFGNMSALAMPRGLSTIEGNTVTSKRGGFELTWPQEYQVNRSGSGSDLSAEMVAITQKDGMQMDFTASYVDEAKKQYVINMAMIVPDENGVPAFSLEELRKEMEESGLDPAAAQAGSCMLGAKSYDYLKVNYGKLMADSMKDYMGRTQMSEKARAQAERYISQMEKMLVSDFYVSHEGNTSYVICQSYSADMAEEAARVLALFQPYTGAEGWEYSDASGWQYRNADGSLAVNTWVRDEDGLTYHVDGNGQIQTNAWVNEGGRWKYVDEWSHMVTFTTKTIDGVQYSFGADGFMLEGSERPETAYNSGTLSGKTYTSDWANIKLTFPEAAQVLHGEGGEKTYILVGGEHVDVNDPELSYRVTLDFTDCEAELDRYLDSLTAYGRTGGYQVDFSGTVNIGGYEYKACKTSITFSDGTSHHSDWYIRQIDGKMVELNFDYYEELKSQAEQVFASISPVNG